MTFSQDNFKVVVVGTENEKSSKSAIYSCAYLKGQFTKI